MQTHTHTDWKEEGYLKAKLWGKRFDPSSSLSHSQTLPTYTWSLFIVYDSVFVNRGIQFFTCQTQWEKTHRSLNNHVSGEKQLRTCLLCLLFVNSSVSRSEWHPHCCSVFSKTEHGQNKSEVKLFPITVSWSIGKAIKKMFVLFISNCLLFIIQTKKALMIKATYHNKYMPLFFNNELLKTNSENKCNWLQHQGFPSHSRL